MRKICVVTGTRAEYGLLRRVMEGIRNSSKLDLQLIATGMHLSPEFGLNTSSNTYGNEILTIAKNRSAAPAATWEDEEDITYHTDESWHLEAVEFFSAIEFNREVKIGNSTDALKLMKIIDKIYSFKKEKR